LVDESAVSHIPKINAKNVKEVDNATLESGGIAYLNDDEDDYEQRTNMARSSFRDESAEALSKVGSFFKKTGGLIAKKYEETDFKAIGQSIKTGATSAGKTVVETTEAVDVQLTQKVSELKESEEMNNAEAKIKTGWSALRTKVKGIFAKNEGERNEAAGDEGPQDDLGSPVPDMLRLEGQEE